MLYIVSVGYGLIIVWVIVGLRWWLRIGCMILLGLGLFKMLRLGGFCGVVV